MERQWAAGQLVDIGRRMKVKDKDELVPKRLLLVGEDDGVYTGCLVYIDEEGKVGTMSKKFYRTYSGLSATQTNLSYRYTSMDQVRNDSGIFKPYFPAEDSAA